eukprot:1747962-Rhodomonas_salina.4
MGGTDGAYGPQRFAAGCRKSFPRGAHPELWLRQVLIAPAPRKQTQETAFLVQIVLSMRFLVCDLSM